MVMKIKTLITYDDPFTGKEIERELGGCAGYIPVFKTIEEAEEESVDGKFDIVAVSQKIE